MEEGDMPDRIALLDTRVPPGTKATDHFSALANMLAERGQPPVFGMGVMLDLFSELGEWGRVWAWIEALAALVDKPIMCNVQVADGSQTAVIPPRGWTHERLGGYIAGFHGQLESAFGRIERVENRTSKGA